jgi:hypothetical protein
MLGWSKAEACQDSVLAGLALSYLLSPDSRFASGSYSQQSESGEDVNNASLNDIGCVAEA